MQHKNHVYWNDWVESLSLFLDDFRCSFDPKGWVQEVRSSLGTWKVECIIRRKRTAGALETDAQNPFSNSIRSASFREVASGHTWGNTFDTTSAGKSSSTSIKHGLFEVTNSRCRERTLTQRELDFSFFSDTGMPHPAHIHPHAIDFKLPDIIIFWGKTQSSIATQRAALCE